jgi:hypothetical protein
LQLLPKKPGSSPSFSEIYFYFKLRLPSGQSYVWFSPNFSPLSFPETWQRKGKRPISAGFGGAEGPSAWAWKMAPSLRARQPRTPARLSFFTLCFAGSAWPDMRGPVDVAIQAPYT